ncbi:hypothetical protein HK101_010853 [Irineochytrium annulatum]|nr:hypothetical protein HK101_010853 [Irineochytrium annulatum]
MPPKRKAEDQGSCHVEESNCLNGSGEGKKVALHPLFSGKKATVDWRDDGSVIIGTYLDQAPNRKIASFDFDDTIVKPDGSHVFSKSPSDWRFITPSVPKTLAEISKTHRIVIFTNQRNLRGDEKKKKAGAKKAAHSKESIFKGKVTAAADVAGVPLLVLAAVEDDYYRKPRMGMWEKLESLNIIEGGIDKAESYFCGDAAGRPARDTRKKDHSDTDYKFALNCGITFKLPEEVFMGNTLELKHIPTKFDFHPREIAKISAEDGPPLFTPTSTPLIAKQQPEIILFIGAPASGKSSFYKRHLSSHGYIHVNQDTLKNKKACLRAVKEALRAGKSVVVDNTNPDVDTRKEYLTIAAEAGIPARAFHFNSAMELCEHNSYFRAFVTKGTPEERERIPSMAFNIFKGKMVPPDVKEGFVEVKKINFIPQFESEDLRKKWELWH